MKGESGISKMWRAVIAKNTPPTNPAKLTLWSLTRDYNIAQANYDQAIRKVNRLYEELCLRSALLERAGSDERNSGGRSDADG